MVKMFYNVYRSDAYVQILADIRQVTPEHEINTF